MILQDVISLFGRIIGQVRLLSLKRGLEYTQEDWSKYVHQHTERRWFSLRVDKNPLDLWIFQEIIYEVKPDYIIETGTQFGGTTFFLAHLLDLLGHGEVITIDIIDGMAPEVKAHPRVIQIVGSSTSTQTVEKIRRIVKNGRTLVDLDSEHTTDHVLRELELYSPFVSVGSYVIVEDTMLDTFYHHEGYPSGPLKAVEKFLRKNDNFEIDTSKEKLLITWNPKGYLKRKK